MLEESDRAWDKVATRSYAFHALRDECVHLRVLSLQQVGAWGGRELQRVWAGLVLAWHRVVPGCSTAYACHMAANAVQLVSLLCSHRLTAHSSKQASLLKPAERLACSPTRRAGARLLRCPLCSRLPIPAEAQPSHCGQGTHGRAGRPRSRGGAAGGAAAGVGQAAAAVACTAGGRSCGAVAALWRGVAALASTASSRHLQPCYVMLLARVQQS